MHLTVSLLELFKPGHNNIKSPEYAKLVMCMHRGFGNIVSNTKLVVFEIIETIVTTLYKTMLFEPTFLMQLILDN